MYKLSSKSREVFIYSEKNTEFNYVSSLGICRKDTPKYKGIQVSCYEKGVNSDGLSNSVGMRRNELLRLPFMILHFKIYGLFHRK